MDRTGLGEVREFLRQKADADAPRGDTAFDLVCTLLPEIIALKKRRYTDEEVCGLLAEKGIVMTLGTFRQYFRKARAAQPEAGVTPKMSIQRSTPSKISALNKKSNSTFTDAERRTRTLGHRLNEEV